MRSLGLDPSLSSFGWCVYDSAASTRPRSLVASGHEGTLGDLVPVARFMHARSMVESLLRRFRVDVVGIESPAFDGPFQTTHFGLMTYALEAVFKARKDCVLFDPTTVKYVSTGKSDASKQDVQRAVQLDRMSTDILVSDESDSYAIARAAARFAMLQQGLLNPKDLSQHERRIFLERSKKIGTSVRRTAHIFRENNRFFQFSRIPPGSVELPKKSEIDPKLLEWLESDSPVVRTPACGRKSKRENLQKMREAGDGGPVPESDRQEGWEDLLQTGLQGVRLKKSHIVQKK